MDKEKLVSLLTYDTYEKDREDIANLCEAANKISVAHSGKRICEGDFDDFLEIIDNMIVKNEIEKGEYGLEVNRTVSIDSVTNRKLYFINRVRATNITESINK